MTAFEIVTIPTTTLREPSRDVSVAEIQTPEFQAFLDKLVFTMYEKDGVGIAAPQVGNNIRAIVVNGTGTPECLMNAEIIKASSAMEDSEEGCLSVPKTFGIVRRHKKITVRAINRHGRHVEFEAKNFPGIVLQHEIDHTNGILFIDKAERITEAGRHI